jgi:hypothetical protein
MRPLISTVLPAAFAVLVLGGCAVQNPKPSSGSEKESAPSTGSSAPQSAPPPAQAPGSTPAAEPSQAGTASPATPPGAARTPDERRAAIDRRLDGSLGSFDETLRKEQEAVAQERDAHEAAAGSAQSESSSEEQGEGEPGSAEGRDPPLADAGERKPGESGSRPGDLKSDKDRAAKGGSNTSGTGAGVGEIPDGSYDDIVARRLRKAAEQETDPELKEKLWKEYIEYKKNAGQ